MTKKPKYDDNVAYIYTCKPKYGEKVYKTHDVHAEIYVDQDKDGNVQGVEILNVHEIWVNGRKLWSKL